MKYLVAVVLVLIPNLVAAGPIQWIAEVRGYATDSSGGYGRTFTKQQFQDSAYHALDQLGAGYLTEGYGFVAGEADYGLLAGRAYGFASDLNDAGFANGGGSLILRFFDVLTIGSTSLMAGTPVQLRLTMNLDDTFSADTPDTFFRCQTSSAATGCATAEARFNGQSLLHYLQGPHQPQSLSFLVNASVGGSVGLSGELLVAAMSFGHSGVTDVTAQAAFFVDVLTSGASFTSESGHGYQVAAVPEPASLGLVTLGVLTNVFWGTVRTRSRLCRRKGDNAS